MGQLIGVIGPKGLAKTFNTLGYRVVGGATFRDAAKSILDEQKSSGTFPIVLVDQRAPGIGIWVDSQLRSNPSVRLLPSEDGDLAGHPMMLEAGISVGDLCASMGLDTPDGAPENSFLIGLGGEVADGSMPAHADEPVYTPTVEVAADPTYIPASVPTLDEEPPQLSAPSPVQAPPPAVPTPVASDTGGGGPLASSGPSWLTGRPATPPADTVAPQPAPPVAVQPVAPAFTPAPVFTPEPAPAPPAPSFLDQHSAFLAQQQAFSRSAEVLISWAAKGGVGKTSLALTAAQTASEAGLRVLVVDANRGQASVRHNLRVAGDGLPTIYDARLGDPLRSVVTAEHLGQVRAAARGAVLFDVVMGPPEGMAGPEHTPASLYMHVIGQLVHNYDLVVIDTQILEAEGDMTDMWAEVMVPLLRGGAWGLGLFDESASGYEHLDERLTMLSGLGVPSGRMLALLNVQDEFGEQELAYFAQRYAGRARLIGSIQRDTFFHDRLSAGFIPTDSPAVIPGIHAVLHAITGRAEFAPAPPKRTRRFGRGRK